MMRNVVGFLALVAAFTLALWLGWWTVPAVAALWGLLRPATWRPILSAALAAALGTVLWLLVDGLAGSGALTRLGSRLAGVLHLPFALLLLLTLLFPAILAWSAAALACGLAGRFEPHSGASR